MNTANRVFNLIQTKLDTTFSIQLTARRLAAPKRGSALLPSAWHWKIK